MAMFGAGGGGNFDPSNWVDMKVYHDVMDGNNDVGSFHRYRKNKNKKNDDSDNDKNKKHTEITIKASTLIHIIALLGFFVITLIMIGIITGASYDIQFDLSTIHIILLAFVPFVWLIGCYLTGFSVLHHKQHGNNSAKKEDDKIKHSVENNEENDKNEAMFLDTEKYAKDKKNELYYTKLLLEKFPELKDKYSVDNHDEPLFIIKDMAENKDFDSAIKYLSHLIDAVDYDYLFENNIDLASKLSLDIVRYMLSELSCDGQENNDQKVANFFAKNTKLFDICFKHCNWKDWDFGLKKTLETYMRLFERVNNFEHEKLAYETFLEYHKELANVDRMANFWYVFCKFNAMQEERLYNFYKEKISVLEEKGKDALYQLEYQKQHKDRINCTFDRWHIIAK